MTINVRRRFQEVGHCGPTCISMMLECQGILLEPSDLVEAAGIGSTIAERGSRIDQMAQALNAMSVDAVLLGRFESTLRDVEGIISDFVIPVGVEWQGRFKGPVEPFDVGHYSLIVSLDSKSGLLTMVDPDADAFWDDGKVATVEFQSRWWEVNRLDDVHWSRSQGLSFVVVRDDAAKKLIDRGYEPISWDFARRWSIDL